MTSIVHTKAFQACMGHIADTGTLLMDGVVEKALAAMRSRDQVDGAERHMLGTAVQLLQRHRDRLTRRFPEELAALVLRAAQVASPEADPVSLSFDQLELMDDSQVLENVELARMHQSVLLSAEAEIAELDARLSSAFGLRSVRSDSNPFRPEVFGQALRNVLQELGEPADVRLRWMHSVSLALGQQLRGVYGGMNTLLRGMGISLAAYSVTQTPDARVASAKPGADGGGSTSGSAPVVQVRTSLTMDQLHRLVTGELAGGLGQQGHGFSEGGFAMSSAPPARPRFAATVPAALEALQEMQQLDVAVDRLRRAGKDELTLGQRLGREVVKLMVGNMVQDERLLEPVRDAIARLEPALLRLAMSDPRFFSDKSHPARVLLDRVTQRSMAFSSSHAPGFAAMMAPVDQCVRILLEAPIEDHAPFAAALTLIEQAWAEQEASLRTARAHAVQALMQAEQRNLLARKIAHELAGRPDVLQAPDFIKEFLGGAWAQAMAQAQMEHGSNEPGSLGHMSLVDDLLWSVLPEQVRRNRPKLMRIIPTLLPRLRAGLQSVGYPQGSATRFFAELMKVHQEVIKAPAIPSGHAGPTPPPLSREALSAQFDAASGRGPWLAPQEVQNSGFMDMDQTVPQDAGPSTRPMPYEDRPVQAPSTGEPALPESVTSAVKAMLKVGVWVEFVAQGEWLRARLTWASPQGLLFMFVGSNGQPYSMSLKTLERLYAGDSLREVAQRDVVSGALNAVARSAMRNSVDDSI